MGGGALAYALRDSGRKILLLERGDYLPSEPDNWDPEAVFKQKKYKPREQWYDDAGNTFLPGVHYFVGSASSLHPNGLANSSGLVGRNYMVHNNTALMAVDPFRINPTTFQKTMAVNDFYFRGEEGYRFPLGNLQLLGKLQAGMLTANQRWVPKPILGAFAHRSVDWWVMSEDLPDPQNRVTLGAGGRIEVRFRPNNLRAHNRLIRSATRMLRKAGFPIVLIQRMGIET